MGPDASKFNSCYLMIEKASGWTEQMHLDAAAQLFEKVEEKPWKFSTRARILHECPKYKPKHDPKPEEGEEEEDGKPKATGKANPVASIQGKGLAFPVGTKKAKKQAFAAKLDMESVASTAQTDAILQVAKASADLSKGFEKKRKIDSMHKTVQASLKWTCLIKPRSC